MDKCPLFFVYRVEPFTLCVIKIETFASDPKEALT